MGTAGSLVGRDRELTLLLASLEQEGPRAQFVYGPAGVGKSALVAAFGAAAEERGARVVRVDCGSLEPTAEGFLHALAHATGTPVLDVAAAAASLAALHPLVVLVVDTYERFRISDHWMRHGFLPAMSEAVRVVIAGREPPIASWSGPGPWHDAVRSVRLGPLDERDALALLREADVADADARAVNRVARGLPLALRIAAVALEERPGLRVEDAAIPRVVEELTAVYLAHLDEGTRRVIDAAAVVRRATLPLMRAMLPDRSAEESIATLASLPFVEHGADGLRLHDAVSAAVATRLRALDPPTYRRYAGAAWKQLRKDLRGVPKADLWRYTADMLYLIENPVVREAFFPSTDHLYVVERAEPEDAQAIFQIATKHEPAEAVGVLERWWDAARESFGVVRDRSRAVVGFSLVANDERVPARLVREDPVLGAWREHLSRHPLPREQRVLLDRRFLERDVGEGPSQAQAAAWLDIKRRYMEMRPNLGRLYSTIADPSPFIDALIALGFTPFPAPVLVGATEFHCAHLDFGPRSVDGWLARVAASEIGVTEEDLLDHASREVVLDGERIALSQLEFGVLALLADREGKAVGRGDLIQGVWGHAYLGGSNIVDVTVRSLRKKLGARADMVETVRGVGYRFKRP